MQWPEAPTCHTRYRDAAIVWESRTIQGPLHPGHGPAPTPDAQRWYRQCSYCSSLHPEDLLTAIARGASIHGADWKYGWPHKFYLDNIWNPTPNVQVLVSASYRDDNVTNVVWGPVGSFSGKWYTHHACDEGFDDEAWERFTRVLGDKTGITYQRNDGGVMWLRMPP